MIDTNRVWVATYLREHGFSLDGVERDANWNIAIDASKRLGILIADYDTIENAEKVLQLAKRLKALVAFS